MVYRPTRKLQKNRSNNTQVSMEKHRSTRSTGRRSHDITHSSIPVAVPTMPTMPTETRANGNKLLLVKTKNRSSSGSSGSSNADASILSEHSLSFKTKPVRSIPHFGRGSKLSVKGPFKPELVAQYKTPESKRKRNESFVKIPENLNTSDIKPPTPKRNPFKGRMKCKVNFNSKPDLTFGLNTQNAHVKEFTGRTSPKKQMSYCGLTENSKQPLSTRTIHGKGVKELQERVKNLENTYNEVNKENESLKEKQEETGRHMNTLRIKVEKYHSCFDKFNIDPVSLEKCEGEEAQREDERVKSEKLLEWVTQVNTKSSVLTDGIQSLLHDLQPTRTLFDELE